MHATATTRACQTDGEHWNFSEVPQKVGKRGKTGLRRASQAASAPGCETVLGEARVTITMTRLDAIWDQLFLAEQSEISGSWSSTTLRVTPAMEAGISDHVWTLEEIASLNN